MKKDRKNRKNSLRLTAETLRYLEHPELTEVVGGAVVTGDACSGSRQPTFCLACNV